MNNYEILIHGRNFYLKGFFGNVKKVGFYTHRYLNAFSVEEAKGKAEELIINESKNDFLNDDSNIGEIVIEEIIELDSFEGIMVPGKGYTFYPMNPNIFQRVLNKIFQNDNN